MLKTDGARDEMMTVTPRQLINDENVQDLDDATVLCKYMPCTPHFESLIQNARKPLSQAAQRV